ncbi:11434_t:CDS:1, partial [Funneliformis caledonium]
LKTNRDLTYFEPFIKTDWTYFTYFDIEGYVNNSPEVKVVITTSQVLRQQE